MSEQDNDRLITVRASELRRVFRAVARDAALGGHWQGGVNIGLEYLASLEAAQPSPPHDGAAHPSLLLTDRLAYEGWVRNRSDQPLAIPESADGICGCCDDGGWVKDGICVVCGWGDVDHRRLYEQSRDGAAGVRAELLAFAAALARDEVAGYALARIVPCSTDEDGHVDDWDFAPLYDTDEAPLDDAAYVPVVDAYAEWVNRPDLLASPPPAGEQGR